MTLSPCFCCSKMSIMIMGKEQEILRLCVKLFASKLSTSDIQTACICLKCYLRLKLCYAYGKHFLNLHRYLKKMVPLPTKNILTTLKDVPIILECPVCFAYQPSSRHIYEHLSRQVECNGCGNNVDNLHDHYTVSMKCAPRDVTNQETQTVFFCRGECGASFERSTLLELHQMKCDYVESRVKIEPEITSDSDEIFVFNSADFMTTGTKGVCYPTNNMSSDTSNGLLVGPSEYLNAQSTINQQQDAEAIIQNSFECAKEVVGTTYKRIRHKRCCPLCGKWFSKLHLHLDTHNSSRHYECKYCHKSFRTDKSCQLHQIYLCPQRKYRTSDATNRRWVCETCGKSFVNKSTWQSHKYLHIKYPCSVCGEIVNKASEVTHMATKHDNVSIVCEYCGKVSKNRHSLTTHINKHHRNDRKLYACDICGKNFVAKWLMRSHHQTHEALQVIPMAHRLRTCNVPSCSDKTSPRFNIPSELKIQKIWMERIFENSEKMWTKNLRVCKSHFNDKCFAESGRLLKYCLPTLKLRAYDHEEFSPMFIPLETTESYKTLDTVKEIFNRLPPRNDFEGKCAFGRDSPPLRPRTPTKCYRGPRK